MSRPIEASIDQAALRGNYAVAKKHAGGASVFAVVKANGYGHELDIVGEALADADGFALLELDAAIRLRLRGLRQPILMLEGFFDPRELPVYAEHGLVAVIHAEEQLRMLDKAKLRSPIGVFAKANTGMNRLGFALQRYPAVLDELGRCGNVAQVVAMTHYADADGPRGVDWQLERLRAALGDRRLPMSTANSAALLRHPQTVGDWARPGIMLYGASPFPEIAAAELGLRPAMTLHSRIIAVQQLAAGDRVGYAGTYVAGKPMRIGVVACGYADGYPRHAPSGTPVLVDGERAPTVGLVSMDMMCVDLSKLAEAGVGTEAILWGEGLPVEEVAGAAGTVSYELLCARTARVPVVATGARPVAGKILRNAE
jgi:alanine racemase